MLWHSKPLLDSGIITKAKHPGSMAQGHLLARRRLLTARPPLGDKVLLEVDNFPASGLSPECYIIGSHGILAALLPPLGPISHIGQNLSSTWIPYRISSAHVWLHPNLAYLYSAASKVTLTTRIHHRHYPNAESTASSAALFNRHYLAQWRFQLTTCTYLPWKLVTSSKLSASKTLIFR